MSLNPNTIKINHKLPLYVSPVLDSHALAVDAFSMNWNLLHAYAFPPTILIPSILAKIHQSQCRIVLIAPLLASMAVVLRGSTTISVSSNSSSTLSKTSDTIKRKISTSKPPFTRPSRLGVLKQSIRDKKFHKTLQILSQNQDENLLRKSMMQNGSYTLIGVIERRLIRSQPLLQS